MAGLFGGSRGGGGPIGLFGRTRGIGDEEQRRLTELAMLAGELGGSLQSQDLPGMPPHEHLGKSLVPPAQLSLLAGDATMGGGGLPVERPSSGSPFPPGFAGDPHVLGAQAAAAGGLGRSPIGGRRAEAEGYADQVARRGTPQWGSAVRDFVMQGPHSSGNDGSGRDEGPTGSGFVGSAEEDGLGFGLGPAETVTEGSGRAEAEAGNLRSAALFWEGEGSPTQSMRPVAFQDGFERAQDRAIAQEQAKRTGGNAGEIYSSLRGFPGEKSEQRMSPVPARSTQARPRGSTMPNPNIERAPTPRELLKSRVRIKESSGEDRAVNRRAGSTADGRYQFTDDTWAELHRGIYGGDGLADKFNPEKQERLMDTLLNKSERALRNAGFEPTATNLYLAHFVGRTGAIRILRNQSRPVETLLSRRAIEGNPQIRGMKAAEVIDYADRVMNGEPPNPQPSRGQTPARVPRR